MEHNRFRCLCLPLVTRHGEAQAGKQGQGRNSVDGNATGAASVLLTAGGSTWTMVSNRDAKENVEPMDARAVLDKLADLPVFTWNHRDQDDSIRHMGPMAQDFYAAFGLGLGEKIIDAIDLNGVALAAIQGLNAEGACGEARKPVSGGRNRREEAARGSVCSTRPLERVVVNTNKERARCAPFRRAETRHHSQHRKISGLSGRTTLF